MIRALVLGLMLCAIAACGTSRSNTSPDSTPAPSGADVSPPEHPDRATLLRRLAEAADGYRDGKPRFVVAGLEFPHPVREVTERPERADSLVLELSGDPANYRRFGPFRAVEREPVTIDSASVVETVIVITHGGDTIQFSADSVDAMFWGLPAFDKFIAPYLTSVYDASYAADHRRWYRTDNDSSLAHSELITHYRRSF